MQPLWHVLAAVLLASLLGCGADAGGVAAPAISGPELAERIAQGTAPVILDVRSPEEFASGHVPGARNVPHTELAARLGELDLPSTAEVVVYCERGGRAEQAGALLRQAGFEDVRALEGDMSAWRAARLPCQGC